MSVSKTPNNVIPFQFGASFPCPACRGKGLITQFAGRVSGESKCKRCDGTGKIGAK